MRALAAAILAGLMLAGCGGEPGSRTAPESARSDPAATEALAPSPQDAAAVEAALDGAGERFVHLALALGEHDANFVDAYHGPAAWAEAAKAAPVSLADLEIEAEALIAMLDEVAAPNPRAAMLRKLTIAALTRTQMAGGRTFDFDTETLSLYDAVAPEYDLAEFDAALAEIDTLLPGEGALATRVEAFRNSLAVPEDRLRAVFDAAIAECRRRTLAHYALPEGERFRMEFVTDKPWGGYNWYQGDYESLIEVNTDFPIIIDRAVDLGCHEGYPGHHLWNVFIERDFLKKNGWIEYSVYPLFSPLSLIAEGSANYGIELAFPGDEKIAFERDVLFPLAGLDPAKAETLDRLNKARRALSHARNAVARDYLDGRIDRERAIDLTMKYGLTSRERAEQSVRFVETYRGYVINYNLGRDLVEAYVSRAVAAGGDPWEAFRILLTSPVSASDLAPAAQ